jgi:mannose-6-phosphate isomerase-like protein (cupin superfamily)
MKFLFKESKEIQITDQIILNEYCSDISNLAIDGAYAKINGPYGPKINTTFSELFFVITGKLRIDLNGEIHELNKKDFLIIPPNSKHKILGDHCEVFIACSPQFNINDVEFVD